MHALRRGCIFWMLVTCQVSLVVADTYTGTALSLEWLVDSADAVVQVHLDYRNTEDGPVPASQVRSWKTQVPASIVSDLFRRSSHEKDTDDRRLQVQMAGSSRWIDASRYPRQAVDWLLFLRTEGKSWRVVYLVNLSRPKEQSLTAAITASGVLLDQKDEILKWVQDRVTVDRRLPNHCSRETIDRWGEPSGGVLQWYEDTRHQDFFLSQERVSEILGGFAIDVSVDYWDTPDPGDRDEDLLLTQIIVPADETHRQPLLDKLQSQPTASPRQLLALLNYPGPQSEATLERLQTSGSVPNADASRLLYYFHYRLNPAHPLDGKLVGKWLLSCRHESVELDLRADHTCNILTRPHESHQGRATEGKGYWAVRHGKLWIGRSHIRRADRWSMARREFFPPKQMLAVTDEEVRLEGGPPMKRIP